MYVTHSPCPRCARIIVQAGITRVVYKVAYKGAWNTMDLLKKANVELILWEGGQQ
jgi:dCMP deaminase